MSVTRSLTTAMLPSGSMRMAGGSASSASGAGRPGARAISAAWAMASDTWVLQASLAQPLMRMPQEPQMAWRQARRKASVPSSSSWTAISASSTVEPSGRLIS